MCLSLWSEVAVGHAVGAAMKVEVGVQGDEEVAVLLGKVPLVVGSGLSPSLTESVVCGFCQ